MNLIQKIPTDAAWHELLPVILDLCEEKWALLAQDTGRSASLFRVLFEEVSARRFLRMYRIGRFGAILDPTDGNNTIPLPHAAAGLFVEMESRFALQRHTELLRPMRYAHISRGLEGAVFRINCMLLKAWNNPLGEYEDELERLQVGPPDTSEFHARVAALDRVLDELDAAFPGIAVSSQLRGEVRISKRDITYARYTGGDQRTDAVYRQGLGYFGLQGGFLRCTLQNRGTFHMRILHAVAALAPYFENQSTLSYVMRAQGVEIL